MNNILLSVPVFDGSLFVWKGGEGSVEASTITCGLWLPFAQLYSDSTDVGFCIRSPKTGVKKVFALVNQIRQLRGAEQHYEVTGWVLKSEDGIVVKIWND